MTNTLPGRASINPLQRLKSPNIPIFRTRFGLNRSFASSHEAVQYDRGFTEFPTAPPGRLDTPRGEGYRDAQAAQESSCEVTDSFTNDDDGSCFSCAGTGEGLFDNLICTSCRGRGQ